MKYGIDQDMPRELADELMALPQWKELHALAAEREAICDVMDAVTARQFEAVLAADIEECRAWRKAHAAAEAANDIYHEARVRCLATYANYILGRADEAQVETARLEQTDASERYIPLSWEASELRDAAFMACYERPEEVPEVAKINEELSAARDEHRRIAERLEQLRWPFIVEQRLSDR